MKPQSVTCPECDGPMVSRVRARDGSRFWGCRLFPLCRGTRTVDGEPSRPRGRGDAREADPAAPSDLPSAAMARRDRRRWGRMTLPPTVRNICYGSDGEATRLLYAQLAALGPAGAVALNLFRACKNSERAKVYRGGVPGQGSYRRLAYGRKEWALENLVAILQSHASALAITWGWSRDEATRGFSWVLYVDTPHGQVSFHAPGRGEGPDYGAAWDGVPGASAERVIQWCDVLLRAAVAV